MLKNYIKTAFRSLLRRWGYSLINVAGLAIGIACCLLIFQYVAFEHSFDEFNVNSEDLYRVTFTSSRSGERAETIALGGYALAPALADAVPEVVRYARVHPDYNNPIISNPDQPEKAFEESDVFYTDPAFLQMFSYPLVSGDPERALAEPGTIVISESAAEKYFGTENPLGKVLAVTGWIRGDFRVTGVFRDVPANSHLQFDFLLPTDDLLQQSGYSDPETGWNRINFHTYVQLGTNADHAEVERKFTEVLLNNRGESFREQNIIAALNAQPLREIHLNDQVAAPGAVIGSQRTVYFFSVIGLITFLIALINYVNLATARALDRSREVGVRKVIGAQRGQLITQFFFESALTNLAALALAAGMAAAALPLVNTFAGTSLPSTPWANPWFWTALVAVFLFGTLLAGLYPAFVLSSFKPISVLKGKAGSFAARLWLRRALVVLQFAASVILLVGTAIVYAQLTYMRNIDLGIELEQILTVAGPRALEGGADRPEASRTFQQELRQIPGIRQIATSDAVPGKGFNWYAFGHRASADPNTSVSGVLAWVDTSFAAVYDLQMAAGEGFKGMSGVRVEGQPAPVIPNETAVKALGFGSPGEALDQLVTFGGVDFRIVGVFRDFNWSSAHTALANSFFVLTPSGEDFSIKVDTGNLSETIAAIEQIYTAHFPGNPFLYAFADEQFNEQYRSDQRFATLFGIFAGLAILIACLGLFGLAAFTAQQRTKEIGVRKVLGASVPSLVALLSKEFLMLVGIAFVVAAPLAYFAMQRWLEDFAYRMEIGPNIFIFTCAIIVAIAMVTISFQSIKAALTDPVKSLRYE